MASYNFGRRQVGTPRSRLEELIGIDVDLVLGRGPEPNQEAVEVVEDRLVLLVDGAVSTLVD